LVRGIIYFEKKGIKLPQKTTSPNEQRIFPKGPRDFLQGEKKNGSTNHVPVGDQLLLGNKSKGE
jgi:hypothetical protein